METKIITGYILTTELVDDMTYEFFEKLKDIQAAKKQCTLNGIKACISNRITFKIPANKRIKNQINNNLKRKQ